MNIVWCLWSASMYFDAGEAAVGTVQILRISRKSTSTGSLFCAFDICFSNKRSRWTRGFRFRAPVVGKRPRVQLVERSFLRRALATKPRVKSACTDTSYRAITAPLKMQDATGKSNKSDVRPVQSCTRSPFRFTCSSLVRQAAAVPSLRTPDRHPRWISSPAA